VLHCPRHGVFRMHLIRDRDKGRDWGRDKDRETPLTAPALTIQSRGRTEVTHAVLSLLTLHFHLSLCFYFHSVLTPITIHCHIVSAEIFLTPLTLIRSSVSFSHLLFASPPSPFASSFPSSTTFLLTFSLSLPHSLHRSPSDTLLLFLPPSPIGGAYGGQANSRPVVRDDGAAANIVPISAINPYSSKLVPHSSVSVCLSVSLSVYLCVNLPLCTYMSLCICVHLSASF
jgi:hypothetical protein